MSLRFLALWGALLGCGDAPDPKERCLAEGAECCEDAACGAGAICHFVYTCAVRRGEYTCSEPIGDRRCHDLCEADSGLGDCADLGQVCQTVEHVQGGDRVEEVSACF